MGFKLRFLIGRDLLNKISPSKHMNYMCDVVPPTLLGPSDKFCSHGIRRSLGVQPWINLFRGFSVREELRTMCESLAKGFSQLLQHKSEVVVGRCEEGFSWAVGVELLFLIPT